MGSRDEHDTKHAKIRKVISLVTLSLSIAAVVKELRAPAQERTWNGIVAGFVPYDFRMPTLDRLKARMWNPESEHIVGPRVFGVGWTLNAGRVVALAREKIAG